ncbi:MAG: hypothetical protein OQL18_00380 [Deltaproteobacteria bacterium]|jgi:hypothetical protein|nr:hypothetical protein [Deltaproteobacteria bacterium]
MRAILGFFSVSIMCHMAIASQAAAAAETSVNGSPLLLILFVGFFSLIVVFQLVPACLMFIGMVKGLGSHKVAQENCTNVKNSHV